MWPEDEVTSPFASSGSAGARSNAAGVAQLDDKLADLIGEDIVVVDPGTPLADVIEMLVELRVPAVCVTDATTLLGVITRTDALRAPPGASAAEVMSTYVLALPATATVGRAAALMAIEHVGHVAVVGDDGGLLGLVSAFDVACHYAMTVGFRR
jgi:CBS domain-containing protein